MISHQNVFSALVKSGENLRGHNAFASGGIAYSWTTNFPLMVPVNKGKYWLINADSYSSSTAKHQAYANRAAGSAAVAIPFSALGQAGIPAYDNPVRLSERLEVVDMSKGIWTTRTKLNPHTEELEEHETHMLGASLISYNPIGHAKRQYFLSGIDETANSGKGYFLTQLKHPAKTIEDAYTQLKPPEIITADADDKPYTRQGEYFFIPKFCLTVPKKEITKGYLIPDRDSNNSHHKARDAVIMPDKQLFVRGTVRHVRGDHRVLYLGEIWHSVHPNNQKRSFNASGGFD